METSTVDGEAEYKSTRTFSEETTVPEILSSAEKLTLFDFANINKTFSETEIIRTASDICRINYLRQQDSSLSGKLINSIMVPDI